MAGTKLPLPPPWTALRILASRGIPLAAAQ
jgi:hypothetical protein